jgi:hypothetical protein
MARNVPSVITGTITSWRSVRLFYPGELSERQVDVVLKGGLINWMRERLD